MNNDQQSMQTPDNRPGTSPIAATQPPSPQTTTPLPVKHSKAMTVFNWIVAGAYMLFTLCLLLGIISIWSRPESWGKSDTFTGIGMYIALGWLFPPVALANGWTLVESIVVLTNRNYRRDTKRFLALKWIWISLGSLILACIFGIVTTQMLR